MIQSEKLRGRAMGDAFDEQLNMLTSWRYASTLRILEEDLTRGLLNIMIPEVYPKESQIVARALLGARRSKIIFEASLPVSKPRCPDLLVSDRNGQLRAVIEVKIEKDLGSADPPGCGCPRYHCEKSCQLCHYRHQWECETAANGSWSEGWSNSVGRNGKAGLSPRFILLAPERGPAALCKPQSGWTRLTHEKLWKRIDARIKSSGGQKHTPALSSLHLLLQHRALPDRGSGPITDNDLAAIRSMTNRDGIPSVQDRLRYLALAHQFASAFAKWAKEAKYPESTEIKVGQGDNRWHRIDRLPYWIKRRAGNLWLYVGVFTGENSHRNVAYGQFRHPAGVVIIGHDRDNDTAIRNATSELGQNSGELQNEQFEAVPIALMHELEVFDSKHLGLLFFEPVYDEGSVVGQAEARFQAVVAAIDAWADPEARSVK